LQKYNKNAIKQKISAFYFAIFPNLRTFVGENENIKKEYLRQWQRKHY
jgi:hypothetical protein